MDETEMPLKPTAIPQETFVKSYLWLLAEAFEGPREGGSAFLDQSSGLFPTLARRHLHPA
jgi:hypothetical protein